LNRQWQAEEPPGSDQECGETEQRAEGCQARDGDGTYYMRNESAKIAARPTTFAKDCAQPHHAQSIQ
jgi:hypothetical protein